MFLMLILSLIKVEISPLGLEKETSHPFLLKKTKGSVWSEIKISEITNFRKRKNS